MTKKDLTKLREEINEIDTRLLKLLAERREASKDVIKTKEITNSPIRDRQREIELLENLITVGKEYKLDSYFITRVFHEVIDDSIRLQQGFLQKMANEAEEGNKILRVAIQGILGSFSSLAAKKFFSEFDEKIVFIGRDTFEDVVRALEQGEADYAMLPIENTTSGGINEVYDALLHANISIIGEETYHVKHCLVALEDVGLDKIIKIYAHHQAAAQCNRFLAKMSDVQVEYINDTAKSAKKVKDEGNTAFAALASREAAEMLGLKVIRENIANQPGNFTRFLIGARKPREVDLRIPCKTSLVMATSQSAGALVDALLIFRDRGIKLTKLESRPVLDNPWEEMFYLDFEGNVLNEKVSEAIDELSKHTRFFKILGCYPSQEIEKTKVDIPLILSKGEIDIDVKSQPENVVAKPKPKKSYKLASREFKSEDTIISVKDVLIGGDNFTVIAGPCSIESYDQIMACASEVRKTGAHILRGGCFKPRTSPYAFQGLGLEGLEMMSEAGKSYNLPIITEVLAIEQIDDVAQKADILQIGARNMQNYSLLKEVGRTHKPVLLKRGMMSSIEELLNATEYILASGNRQVILCERGIRTFETATRNTLDLSAVPVLRELTHLPIFVDPSHAVGQRDKVIPLALAAKTVGAHGIMIEFHPNPEQALSDGPQSLYFKQFHQLMHDLYKY